MHIHILVGMMLYFYQDDEDEVTTPREVYRMN